MKHFIKLIFLLLIFIAISTGCIQDQDSINDVTENKNIINSKGFSVSSDSTELNTSARGTIFVSGEEGIPEHVQIVSMVDIDPDDWGGVAFFIPKNWDISSVTSSYPEEKKGKKPEDYVSVWTYSKETKNGENKMIEIGRDAHRFTPTGGGKGTVVIELEINEEEISTSDVFNITVGVGSKLNEGIRSIHPDYELIEIPIP